LVLLSVPILREDQLNWKSVIAVAERRGPREALFGTIPQQSTQSRTELFQLQSSSTNPAVGIDIDQQRVDPEACYP
jgi:hypothetical protein